VQVHRRAGGLLLDDDRLELLLAGRHRAAGRGGRRPGVRLQRLQPRFVAGEELLIKSSVSAE